MSLILDALKKARLVAQGSNAPTEAQTLMKSFGVSQRARRRQGRRTLLMYGVPVVVLATGIAVAGNYWLGQRAKASMTVSRPLEPAVTPTPAPAPAPAPLDNPAPAAPPVAATTTPANPAPRPTPPQTLQTAAPARSAPPAPRTEETPLVAADRKVSAPEVAVPTATAPPAPRQPAPAAPPDVAVRDPYEAMIAYFNIGDYPKALEECRKAVAKRPDDSSTHANCGAVHIRLNNLTEAIAELNKAIALDRTNDKAFLNLGAVYMAQGDNVSADGAFEKTIELNPNNAGAYRNRGIIARRSNKPELAKNFFLEATRHDSQDMAAHYDLAVVYDEQGETGKAIEYFRKFRDLAKGLPDWRAEVNHAVSRIEELEKKLPRP